MASQKKTNFIAEAKKPNNPNFSDEEESQENYKPKITDAPKQKFLHLDRAKVYEIIHKAHSHKTATINSSAAHKVALLNDTQLISEPSSGAIPKSADIYSEEADFILLKF